MRSRRTVLFASTCCMILAFASYVFSAYTTLHGVRYKLEYESKNIIIEASRERIVTEPVHARIAIVQYYGGYNDQKLPLGFLAARNILQKYAQKHGYALYFFDEKTVQLSVEELKELALFGSNQHHWRKPFYLSRLLEAGDHEWYAYFDTDIVITNPTIPLEHWIDANANNDSNMIISDDPSGICNGVFFQKASSWALQFNTLWWNERQSSRSGHDNWPFMAALLESWAASSGYEYDGSCSMAKHIQMESWSSFLPCYMKHIDSMGMRTTHPGGCSSDYPDPCGSAKLGDPNVVAVWELNKGIGFGGKNVWTEGSFLIHFAGRGSNRHEIMAQYANATMQTYSKYLLK